MDIDPVIEKFSDPFFGGRTNCRIKEGCEEKALKHIYHLSDVEIKYIKEDKKSDQVVSQPYSVRRK